MPERDVADLHPVGRVRAEGGRHVGLGPLGEVLPQLVADHRGTGAQHGHGEGARPHARLQHALARPDVGRHENGPEVLRVDHLGAPGHFEHHVVERGAQHQEAATCGAGDGPPLVGADEVVVRHHAGVRVEGGPGDQGDEVTPVLGVDEEHALPRHQGARHGRQASTVAGAALGSRHGDEHLLARGDGDRRDDARPVVQHAPEDEGGPGQQEPVPVPGQPPSDPGPQEAAQQDVHVRAAGSRPRPTWTGRGGARPGRPGR